MVIFDLFPTMSQEHAIENYSSQFAYYERLKIVLRDETRQILKLVPCSPPNMRWSRELLISLWKNEETKRARTKRHSRFTWERSNFHREILVAKINISPRLISKVCRVAMGSSPYSFFESIYLIVPLRLTYRNESACRNSYKKCNTVTLRIHIYNVSLKILSYIK